MKALMLTTQPPILYWEPETLYAIKKVRDLRQQGIEVYFTIDAGPNLILLFEEKNKTKVEQLFSEIEVRYKHDYLFSHSS